MYWLMLASCMGKHPPQTTVAKIDFVGNGAPFSSTNSYNLRSAMTQKQNSLLSYLNPRVEKAVYDPTELQLDAWRLENWYAQRGYIDAKVVGWEVYELPQKWWQRDSRIHVTGHVEQGEQVHIRSIRWQRSSQNILQKELDKELLVSVGMPLYMVDIQYSEEALLHLAQNSSYAHANVSIHVDVWPENCNQLLEDKGICLVEQLLVQCAQDKQEHCADLQAKSEQCADDRCMQKIAAEYSLFETRGENWVADLRIAMDEGPSCRFGEVEWLSSTRIPMDALLEQQPFSIGDAYKIDKISKFQQKLFGLNQFSVVMVSPLLDQPSSFIPVQVTVSERKRREMQVGAGGNVERGLLSIQSSVNFSHINLANRLLSLDVNNQFGYSFYPDVNTIQNTNLNTLVGFGGPTVVSSMKLYYPRFINTYWAIGMEFRYELGVQPSYRFSTPMIAPFWSWNQKIQGKYHWFSSVDARLSYYFSNFSYLDLQLSPEQLESAISQGTITEQFRLGYLSQEVILDGRNDPIQTKNGQYLSFATNFAGRWFGGAYDYWKISSEYRYFYSILNVGNIRLPGSKDTIRKKLLAKGKEFPNVDGVVAMRTATTALLPYNSSQQNTQYVPYSQYVFLGGGTDVRGWRSKYLGPYVCLDGSCSSESPSDTVQSGDIVPIGGTFLWYGNLEYRQYLPSDIGFATFLDMGMVWDQISSVSLSDIQPSAGVGLRYVSPIGPVRFDVACRLTQDIRYAMEDRCRLHFAFSESY